MNKLHCIFLIGLIFQIGQGFEIDLETSSIIFKDDVFRLYVNTTGGIEPFTFQFGELADNWVPIGPYLFIPKADVQEIVKHVVRVKVTDGEDQMTEGAIELSSNGQVFSIEPTLYPYDYVFTQRSLELSPAEVQIPAPEARTPYTDPEQFIENSRVGEVRTTLSIDSSFRTLPAMEEIDIFIKNRNQNFLIQTIKRVRGLNMECVEKVAYLEEILGRIGSAVELQKLQISKLEIFDLGAKEQRRRLEEELDRLQQEQKTSRLSLLLPEHTTKENQLEQIQKHLPAILAEIQTLQFEVAEIKFQIIEHIQELSQIQNDIDQITLRLPSLPSSQIAATSMEVQALQRRGREVQFQAQRLNISLSTKELDLENLEKLQIRFKSKRDTMIRQIAELKDKIQNNDQYILTVTRKITEIRVEMVGAEKNNKSSEIFIAQGELTNLKSLWESVQLEVDVTTFGCYGITDVLVNGNNYTLSSGDFLTYIQRMYGVESFSLTQSQVPIQDVDIFSADWEERYGSAFSQAAIALSAAGSSANQLRFQNDFTCLEPSQLQNEEGTILSIENNIIRVEVQSTREVVSLIMGACTKFQTAFELPMAGSYIRWWGIPALEGVYDAYLILTIPSPYV